MVDSMSEEQILKILQFLGIENNKIFQNINIGELYDYSFMQYSSTRVDGKILVMKDVLDWSIYHSVKRKIDAPYVIDYLGIILKYLNKNSLIVFSNPILSDDEALRIAYSDDIVSKVKNIRKELSNRAFQIFNKFYQGMDVTEEEFGFLLNFFIATSKQDKPGLINAKKQFIRAIMSYPKRKFSNKIKNFIFTFLGVEKSRELGISSNVYICNDDVNSLGKNFNCGVIFLNKDYVDKSNFDDMDIFVKDYSHSILKYFEKGEEIPGHVMLLTLYHELKHARDVDDLEKNNATYSSQAIGERILFSRYLKADDYNEYKRNYWFQASEISAEVQGLKDLLGFYQEYVPRGVLDVSEKIKVLIEKEQARYSFAVKFDRQGLAFINDTFAVLNMNTIMSEHPEELENFPIFKNFYNDDGSERSLEELLERRIEPSSDGEELKIYDKYIEHRISMKETFDLNAFSDDKKLDVLAELRKYLPKEYYNTIRVLEAAKNRIINKKLAHAIIQRRVGIFIAIYRVLLAGYDLVCERDLSEADREYLKTIYSFANHNIVKLVDLVHEVGVYFNIEPYGEFDLDLIGDENMRFGPK